MTSYRQGVFCLSSFGLVIEFFFQATDFVFFSFRREEKMKNGKNVCRMKFFGWCVLSLFLLIVLVGCEQLLEEALTRDISFEEPLFDSETATGGENTIPIVTNQQLTKGSTCLPKTLGFVVISVTPPDVALFSVVASSGKADITGTLVNNDTNPVVFKIYFGHSGVLVDPQTEAAFIASVNLAGSETKILGGFEDFDESRESITSNLGAFFSAHPGLTTIYVYLMGEGSQSVNIAVESLAFVLRPSYHVQRTLQPSEEYTQYVDQIQEVTEIQLSGSATNNGVGSATLSLFVTPVSGSASWEGKVAEVTINPGETVLFENWSGLLTDEELERLEGCIEHLVDPGEAIRGDLFLMSDSDLNVEIVSLVLEGTITVTM